MTFIPQSTNHCQIIRTRLAIRFLTGEVGVETQMFQGQGKTAHTDLFVEVTDDSFRFGG
jgi:hypothetical protein